MTKKTTYTRRNHKVSAKAKLVEKLVGIVTVLTVLNVLLGSYFWVWYGFEKVLSILCG